MNAITLWQPWASALYKKYIQKKVIPKFGTYAAYKKALPKAHLIMKDGVYYTVA